MYLNADAKVNHQIALNWALSTSVNTKLFEIQRSKDGINFIRIGDLNSNTNNTYMYTDCNVEDGVLYYYRLRFIDIDNNFDFSKVVSAKLQTINTVKSIHIYPNPTIGRLRIDIDNFSNITGYQIKIVNDMGQLILQHKINNQLTNLDLKDCVKSGIYFAIIMDSNGVQLAVEKIIKQ